MWRRGVDVEGINGGGALDMDRIMAGGNNIGCRVGSGGGEDEVTAVLDPRTSSTEEREKTRDEGRRILLVLVKYIVGGLACDRDVERGCSVVPSCLAFATSLRGSMIISAWRVEWSGTGK